MLEEFFFLLAQNWQRTSGLKHSHGRFEQKSIDIFKDLSLKIVSGTVEVVSFLKQKKSI